MNKDLNKMLVDTERERAALRDENIALKQEIEDLREQLERLRNARLHVD